MQSLSDLGRMLRQHFQPQEPPQLMPSTGLLRSLMEQQRPSENVRFVGPMVGADYVLFQNQLERGLGRGGFKVHPIDWVDSKWPYPPNPYDRQPSQLPIKAQMRGAPALQAMGELLEPPWAP